MSTRDVEDDKQGQTLRLWHHEEIKVKNKVKWKGKRTKNRLVNSQNQKIKTLIERYSCCCAAHVVNHVMPRHPPVIQAACKSTFIDRSILNPLCDVLNVVPTDQSPLGLHQGHGYSIHGDVELPQVGHARHPSLLILPLHWEPRTCTGSLQTHISSQLPKLHENSSMSKETQ